MRPTTLLIGSLIVSLAGCYRPPAPLSTTVQPAPPSPAPSAPAAAAEEVSCEGAAEAVLTVHPAARLARARAALEAARAETTGGWRNPELRGRVGAPDPVDRARLGVRFRLPVPGVNDALRAAAEGEHAESEAERQLVDLEIAATARRLHLAVRREREQVAWRAQQVELEAAAQALARRRVAAGIASRVVLDTADLSLLDARDDLVEARADLRAAEQRLLDWAGVRADSQPCSTEGVAPAEHAGVAAARARRVSAHGEAEAEAREGWLWPTFAEVSWDSREAEPDRILVQLGVLLPVFGGDDAPDPSAVMAVADARVEDRVAAVQRAVRAAQLDVEAAQARLDALGVVEPPALDAPPATLEQLELWRLQHRLAGRSIRVRYGLEAAYVELRRARGAR